MNTWNTQHWRVVSCYVSYSNIVFIGSTNSSNRDTQPCPHTLRNTENKLKNLTQCNLSWPSRLELRFVNRYPVLSSPAILRSLAKSLASTYQMVIILCYENQKYLNTLPSVSWNGLCGRAGEGRGKSPSVEGHCSRFNYQYKETPRISRHWVIIKYK